MFISRIALAGIVSTVGVLSSANLNAASYRHIDNLALQIQHQSAELYREFRIHYRHTPEYRHLISDSVDLYQCANHIHEVAHHHGSVRHLSRDLRKLDKSFHHLEELVGFNELAADGYAGHVHGDTRHVFSLMRRMAENIHHLQDDIEELVSHGQHGRHHGDYHGRVDLGRRGYGSPRYPYPNRVSAGIRIGRGGIYYDGNRIGLRFGH